MCFPFAPLQERIFVRHGQWIALSTCLRIPIERFEKSYSPGVGIYYVLLFLVTKATHVRLRKSVLWVAMKTGVTQKNPKEGQKKSEEMPQRAQWDRANYKYFYFIIIGIRCPCTTCWANHLFSFSTFPTVFCWLTFLFTRFESLWDGRTAAMCIENFKKKKRKRREIFCAELHQLNDMN